MSLAARIHRATWLPVTVPPGEQVELIAPWTTENPRRVLTCVDIDGKTFVIARDRCDAVTNCWRVVGDIR